MSASRSGSRVSRAAAKKPAKRLKGLKEVTPITQNPRPLQLPAAPVQDLSPAPSESAETVLAQSQGHSKTLFGLTPLASAFRFVEPTWRNYIMYVDMEARTGNEDARRYLATWQSLPPRERQAHVPEQLCELATVSAADLIAWVTKQVWVEGSAKASMVMSFNRDRVLERTAQFAMASPDNYRHAELFAKVGGMMPAAPSRGGVTVPIFNMPVASSGSVALAGSKSESSAVHALGLRDMDSEIVELSRIMQREDAPVGSRAEDRREDARDADDEEEDDEGEEDGDD